MAGVLRYDSNNSGGSWWLKDEHWKILERNGWVIHWHHPGSYGPHPVDYLTKVEKPDPEYRWLSALASSCAKRFESAEAGIEEWEHLTDQDSTDLGCGCCGPPHNFHWVDDDGSRKYLYPEVSETRMVEH